MLDVWKHMVAQYTNEKVSYADSNQCTCIAHNLNSVHLASKVRNPTIKKNEHI